MSTAPDAATSRAPLVDLDAAWRLSPMVSVRPEPFGALLYHFGNRRLSFLKDPELLEVVRELGSRRSAREALAAVGVPPERVAALRRALTTLAASDIVVQPPAGGPEGDSS